MVEVKIKRKIFQLSEWMDVGDWRGKKPMSNNRVRHLIPDDDFSCVVLMVSWVMPKLTIAYDPLIWYWSPMFLGPDLASLNELYKKMYPKPPSYRSDQLEGAQAHIDKFLHRVNTLIAFI
jgi:hypothetical protein